MDREPSRRISAPATGLAPTPRAESAALADGGETSRVQSIATFNRKRFFIGWFRMGVDRIQVNRGGAFCNLNVTKSVSSILGTAPDRVLEAKIPTGIQTHLPAVRA